MSGNSTTGYDRSPLPLTGTKHSRYNSSRKGKARNMSYRSKQSGDAYLSRPFIGWDGEGINEPDGSHTYVLLANSEGASLSARQGLSTVSVFELFLSESARIGTANHVIYGGGYDINMFLRDLDMDSLRELYETGKTKWNGYRLEWRGGKSFSVRTLARSFLLYDVLPFFQTSFVKACDEYLGEDWEYRDEIIREKANRGSFTYQGIEVISEYNRAELRTLVRLANELRERLYKVEIRVSRWDGPGAIATTIYKKHGTKSHLGTGNPAVATAGRYAYAGGRFEIIRKGHSSNGAYQYDIRSAYPSAIRHLPCLAHGEWRHVTGARPNIARFGIYRIEVTHPPTLSVTQPQPLWMRNKDGTVYFSEYSHGWYWSPEALLASEVGGCVFHEGWEFIPGCDHEPFAFVEPLYNKRAALKAANDGAHVGLKLGLNSLYGKLAQQIGWDPGPPLRLPPYHSLEWAGWITSHCRSQVYRASLLAPDDIIAFETDAVFTRVPLPLNLGTRLGEWDETIYDSLTYLKSGMYFGTLSLDNPPSKLKNGREVEKMRGINKGTITRQDMIDALAADGRGERPVLHAEQTRFITLGQAMHQDMSKWRHWITSPRDISVALSGKRIDLHDQSEAYAQRYDGWEETDLGPIGTTFSHPYPVEWIEDDDAADMSALFSVKRIDDAHEVPWE